MISEPSVAPATTEDVRGVVRQALAERRTIRIAGSGSWRANRPVSADITLALRDLTGIVDYVPGDLTLTARAGTTLVEIARATGQFGQWLTLDPPGDPARATLGATIATGSYGPLAHQFGTPRDMALGLEFVTGSGDVVRAGGRVVKNVAGFDLTRLLTGSWGSLGVVTEISVRLRARPTVDETIAVSVQPTPAAVEHVRESLRQLPFVPFAAQLLTPSLAAAIGLEQPGTTLLLRIGGNAEAARAQRRQAQALGTVCDAPGRAWDALGTSEPREATVLRLSRLPSRFAVSWTEGCRLVDEYGGYAHGDPGRGVVRCVLPVPEGDHVGAFRRWMESSFSGTRIFERLPMSLWASVPTSMRPPLADRVKRAFDPAGLLNPGILGALA